MELGLILMFVCVRAVAAYTRAPASDFDDWGVDGWESKNLIPLMKKVLGCVVRPSFHAEVGFT